MVQFLEEGNVMKYGIANIKFKKFTWNTFLDLTERRSSQKWSKTEDVRKLFTQLDFNHHCLMTSYIIVDYVEEQ